MTRPVFHALGALFTDSSTPGTRSGRFGTRYGNRIANCQALRERFETQLPRFRLATLRDGWLCGMRCN
jgi:hypothetical protein